MAKLEDIRHDDEETCLADPTLLCPHGHVDQTVVDKVLAAHIDGPGEHDGVTEYREGPADIDDQPQVYEEVF